VKFPEAAGVSILLPEVASAPLHVVPLGPPLALQDVAFVELQVRLVACPVVILDGFVDSVAVTAAAPVTVTTACAVAFGCAL
jgi:hypothetical protein